MGEIPGGIKFVKPEDLPGVKNADGKLVTREMLEENPGLIRGIQNMCGINIDMTPIPAPDSDSTQTP